MRKDIMIYGPPGTGKTTKVSEIVGHLVNKRMRKADDIALTSFTRAAAYELSKKVPGMPKTNIGTLHSFAFRGLNLTEDHIAHAHIDQWNKDHPSLQLSEGKKVDIEEGGFEEDTSATDADLLHSQYQVYRARLTPQALWQPDVARFAKKWDEWKSSLGLYDFSDLIELALDVEKMPCHYVASNKTWAGPGVIIGDEFQDFTKAEIKLFDHWASQADISIKVGDVDQQLYWFKGATPDSMDRPDLPDMNKRVLKQSHRVPQKVHKLAVKWINLIKGRIPIEYHPTEEEGKLLRLDSVVWSEPGPSFIRAIENDLAAGRSVGIMASCDYMVRPTIKALRAAGLPFCNSYAKNRGHYNPLTPGKGVSASQRLLAYMQPSTELFKDGARMWREDDLVQWASVLDSQQALQRGAKKLLEAMKSPDQVTVATLQKIFKPEALADLLAVDVWDLPNLEHIDLATLHHFVNPDPQVFSKYIMQSKKATLEYPLKVSQARGVQALQGPFKLMVGTIHSFKGGEFDSVYVFPDLSYKGYYGLEAGGEHFNSIVRMFYVAFTRSKYKLTIMGAENNKLRVII